MVKMSIIGVTRAAVFRFLLTEWKGRLRIAGMFHKIKWLFISVAILLFIFLVLFLIFPDRLPRRVPGDIEDNRFLLDTVVSIKLYQSGRKDVLEEAFTLIESYENQLSRHKSGSEISRINTAEAGMPTAVSDTTRGLIKTALKYAEISGSSFDPTVAPLVDLWGIGSENPRIPTDAEIADVLPLVDYTSVVIDDDAGTVMMGKNGMALDLGGIAKGWIADRVGEFLIRNGEEHFLINLGGNVLVHGGKPGKKGNSAFKIGVQNPFEKRGLYLGFFTLDEGSVVSSGIYERYFESGGIRYHHILSTKDGYPVENDLAAVTILSKKSVDGDALSTTVFILGLDAGMKLVLSLEGIEAALVTRKGEVVLTPGAEEIFEKR